jgi:iron complex outermembrane receptor protein
MTRHFTAPNLPALLVATGIGWALCVSAAIAEEEPGTQPDATPVETEEPSESSAPNAADSNEVDETEAGQEPVATPTEGIEEITVTGESAESAIAAPVSVVEFDASMILREQIIDIADLAAYTPNLSIKTAFAASNPTIFIRGVGLDDFNANAVGAVAVYQDDVYLNSPAIQLFQLFDTTAIEVLRGPQAGPYRNASAGAILIRSRMPTDEYEGYANFSYGNYEAFDIEGALGGPIPTLGEYLSSRVAFRVQKRDGITENRCAKKHELSNRTVKSPACLILQPNRPNNLGEPQLPLEGKVNDVDQWAVRGMLQLVAPTRNSESEWLLNVHGGQNRSLSAQAQHRGFIPDCVRDLDNRCVIDPDTGNFIPMKIPGRDLDGYEDLDGDPFAGDYNLTPPEDLDLWGASLRGKWSAGESYEIRSISGYEWHDRLVLDHTDANPRNTVVVELTDDAWQFSQQLELHKTWLDELDWMELDTMVGVYFLMEDLDVLNRFDTPPAQNQFDQQYTQKTRTGSVFGTGTWDLFDDFTWDASVRYSWEYKELDLVSKSVGPLGGTFETIEGVESEVFDGVTGSASFEYRFMDSKSAYVKYTRGWKPGHFNGGAVFTGTTISAVDPETVDAFEGGFETSWFDGRLQLNAAAFYYLYENMQIFQIQQASGGIPLFQLINAQKAEILGVEASLHAEPIEGLKIHYEMGWLDSEYPEFVSTIILRVPTPPGAPRKTIEVTSDYTGNRLLGAPDWSMSGSVEYSIPLRRMGTLIPRFSFSWQDDIFYDPAEGRGTLQDLPDDTIGQKAYWLLNAGLLWRNEGDWFEVSGWVRNILDKAYRVQSFDLSEDFHFVADYYGDPRTYGLTLSLYF